MNIYMDNASTTALSQKALDAYVDALSHSNGNPSAVHSRGFEAFTALENSRSEIARLFNCSSEQIVFTSGGSESNSLALLSAANIGKRSGKRHIVTTAIEHHSVLEVLNNLEGFDITYVKPQSNGIVSAEDVISAVRTDTVLVSVMLANNEVGTLQPVGDIASFCRERGVIFHTDAVQAAGHVMIDVDGLGCDMLSLSAHKFHGPKGVGALYVRDKKLITPIIRGGMQESGLRAGTENVPGIVAMAAALRESLDDRVKKNGAILALRERLIEGILNIEGATLNGDRKNRLDGNANFSFDGVGGEQLVLLLDSYGIAASSGSACAARSPDPSHVLLAMGLKRSAAASSLRLSLDEYNTDREIDEVVRTVTKAVNNIRNI